MADKINRKELKQPDAFQQVGAEAQAWVAERQNLIALAAGAVLVIGFIAALVHYWGERRETRNAQELGSALETVSRPVSEGAPPPAQGSVDLQPFASQKEKDEAIVKQLRDYLAAHPKSDNAYAAALPLAQASFRLGQYDEALQAFDQVLKEAPKDEPLRAAALEGQGYAHEAKGELDKAYAAFEALAKENQTEFLSGMGQYHLGRVLLEQGKKEEAAKAFVEVSNQAPNTAAARMATERITALAAQGVAIPAAKAPANASADAGVATP